MGQQQQKNMTIVLNRLRIVVVILFVFLMYQVFVRHKPHEKRLQRSVRKSDETLSDEVQNEVYDEIDSTEFMAETQETFYSSFGQLPGNSIATIMEAYQTSTFGLASQIKSTKRILFWNEAYGSKDYGIGFGRDGFVNLNCPVVDCYTTDNRSLVPVQDFDAVVFHLRSFSSDDIPERRHAKQRYIFWSMESPQYNMRDIYPLNGFFNWTFTYRIDSDIVQPYGWVEPYANRNSHSRVRTNVNDARGKSKLVAWFVSNCESQSNREQYVNALQKHVAVDVYGACGPLKCDRDDTKGCYSMLEKDYKFYLSFENSFCDDYVTEKLFSILKLRIVPIVFGGANYTRYAPPKSYINALDFNTAEDLARYLQLLDVNDELYSEYFKWRRSYRVRNGDGDLKLAMCGLCARLHRDEEEKTYDDMEKWWVRKSHCKKPRKNNVYRIPYWE